MKLSVNLFLTSLLTAFEPNHAFGIFPRTNTVASSALEMAPMKYGPTDEIPVTSDPSPEQKAQFISVFEQILHCGVREELPSILTNNIDVLLELQGDAGVSLINEQVEKIEATGDEEMITRAQAAVEYMVYFIEAFVGEAKRMDDQNKTLLGKIIKCMTGADLDDDPANMDSLARQERLDTMLQEEKDNFTPGFLRHLDGECTRLANAQNMNPETAKLLEVIRIIQTRVIEELGESLGEGAQVLGQLLGYDSSAERLAVLDAGLQVRGVQFASELSALTDEALQGFEARGADPNLVGIVQEINTRIKAFIADN